MTEQSVGVLILNSRGQVITSGPCQACDRTGLLRAALRAESPA